MGGWQTARNVSHMAYERLVHVFLYFICSNVHLGVSSLEQWERTT